MQLIDGRLIYSATDLVGFIECGHLADLNRAVAEGHLEPPREKDAVLDRIAQRGIEHEQRFLEHLREDRDGLRVVDILDDIDHLPYRERLQRGAAATLEAMRSGADVIYQAVLIDGRRQGYADFLRRVEMPSDLGAWSYEVWDTKLARHAKASAVLQLCMYSEMVAAIQGTPPVQMHLALGGVKGEEVSYRVTDYAAYYRSVVRAMETYLDRGEPSFPVASAPEPVEHCGICRWNQRCSGELRAADDLSLVAGLSSRQRKGLIAVDIPTRTALAQAVLPLAEKVHGTSPAALARIHEQARVQVHGQDLGAPYFELISLPRNREGAVTPNVGLGMLPEPSRGDLFFDIEGDPFFSSTEHDGVDYLFGIIEPGALDDGDPRFHAFWSIEDGRITFAAERRAFEQFIDLVMDRLASDPGMHVYHYAPYEPTAVKRLAQRYATREAEVDELLRGRVFVDLYRAVRQGIRAAVESYSIKKMEQFYGYDRTIEMKDANASIVEFETWLELGDTSGAAAEADRTRILGEIEAYNRDDCLSTLRLRDWLEEQRAVLAAEMAAAGDEITRPHEVDDDGREPSDRQLEIMALVEQLTEGISDERRERTPEQHGKWLLAQMLNWHAREQKAFWWRYFYLMNELTDEERREESDALGELTYEGVVDQVKRSLIHRLRFPPQEHKIRVGDSPHDPATGKSAGTVVAVDDSGYIDLSLGMGRDAPTCTSLVPHDPIPTRPKPEALQRIVEDVLERGIEAPDRFRVARDLLRHAPPRLIEGSLEPLPGEDTEAVARRAALHLDDSYLAIQGPPGSGKTTVGGRMIADLVAAGMKVGVTAGSHKVVGNLLEAAGEAARAAGTRIAIGQKGDGEGPTYEDAINLPANGDVASALADGRVDVVGGTTWLWAREDMEDSVDVLFIDEAGQMSLADALAASTCARRVVLLGDPQQLDQPLQGTHPPGAERSALAHILDGASTMPAEFGLFLDGTWRLHPDITAYTSEVFYEGRLHSHPGREAQRVDGTSPYRGTGLRFVPVTHTANSSEAYEEAAAIEGILDELFGGDAAWTGVGGDSERLEREHVLLITPYNAQVRAIEETIGAFRIGTVDKFQGQQAPVSIYSMATSSVEEAPRGMEFLYSLNRLNVATSRARCVAIVVASPELLRVRCRTPRQMRLVNALARFVELESGPA